MVSLQCVATQIRDIRTLCDLHDYVDTIFPPHPSNENHREADAFLRYLCTTGGLGDYFKINNRACFGIYGALATICSLSQYFTISIGAGYAFEKYFAGFRLPPAHPRVIAGTVRLAAANRLSPNWQLPDFPREEVIVFSTDDIERIIGPIAMSFAPNTDLPNQITGRCFTNLCGENVVEGLRVGGVEALRFYIPIIHTN